MATSTNPVHGTRYGLGRAAGPSGAQNPYNPAPAFGANAKTQQRLEAERLDRERKMREERERLEQAGQDSLAQLTEEQREEITEAVSDCNCARLQLWSLSRRKEQGRRLTIGV